MRRFTTATLETLEKVMKQTNPVKMLQIHKKMIIKDTSSIREIPRVLRLIPQNRVVSALYFYEATLKKTPNSKEKTETLVELAEFFLERNHLAQAKSLFDQAKSFSIEDLCLRKRLLLLNIALLKSQQQTQRIVDTLCDQSTLPEIEYRDFFLEALPLISGLSLSYDQNQRLFIVFRQFLAQMENSLDSLTMESQEKELEKIIYSANVFMEIEEYADETGSLISQMLSGARIRYEAKRRFGLAADTNFLERFISSAELRLAASKKQSTLGTTNLERLIRTFLDSYNDPKEFARVFECTEERTFVGNLVLSMAFLSVEHPERFPKEQCIAVVNDFRSRGLFLSSYEFNALLLLSLDSAQTMETKWDIFQSFLNKGLVPNPTTFAILFSSIPKDSNRLVTRKLFEQMAMEAVPFSTSSLIAYLRSIVHHFEAMEIKNQLWHLFFAGFSQSEIDLIWRETFTAILELPPEKKKFLRKQILGNCKFFMPRNEFNWLAVLKLAVEWRDLGTVQEAVLELKALDADVDEVGSILSQLESF